VLACSKDKTLQIWRLDKTASAVTLPAPTSQFSTRMGAFSPDGQRVAVADLDGSAWVWRVDGRGEPVVFRGHLDEVLSVAFSPDGQRVVSTSTDGTARIWHANDARPLVVLRGHDGWVSCAAFSPDGTQVVTGIAGGPFSGTIRVWRADGQGEPLILYAHDNVFRLAFSPDGTRLAAGLENGTVHIWQISWPALLAHLRANVHIPLIPEQRMRFLGETAGEAWANYVEAERQLGHKPQWKRIK
jgi:WD40 repeat protein